MKDFDIGNLKIDLKALSLEPANRRQFLLGLLATALFPKQGCGSGDDACEAIPEETAGPYPADGSDGENALTLSGIVRSDIRNSIAGASGYADGVEMSLKLKLTAAGPDCAPLVGYAVYLWQCDRETNYSMYSQATADENYLRGVQATDANGELTFVTTFPGCYAGRWPHIHIEVFSSLEQATTADNILETSQIALNEDICRTVYATPGYEVSLKNLDDVSLQTDSVFRDGTEHQMATVRGDPSTGIMASLDFSVGV